MKQHNHTLTVNSGQSRNDRVATEPVSIGEAKWLRMIRSLLGLGLGTAAGALLGGWCGWVYGFGDGGELAGLFGFIYSLLGVGAGALLGGLMGLLGGLSCND